MDKNHKNTVANKENGEIGKEYENQFVELGLQQLFPGAKYIGKFKNTFIGSTVEHMFEYNNEIYVADCKGGDGLLRRDTVLDVLAEAVEFKAWKKKTKVKQKYKFIIVTTNLPKPSHIVSVNRIELAKSDHDLHAIYEWNPNKTEQVNVLGFFNG